MPVLFCISSFEVTSYKKLHDTAIQVGYKETVRSQGKQLTDCLSGEKPLGLQFIFHQTKCSLCLLYKLHFWKCSCSQHQNSILKLVLQAEAVNSCQLFINIKKCKRFKIRKYCLGIILFDLAIQNLCFTKSFLIYSPFLPLASLNN